MSTEYKKSFENRRDAFAAAMSRFPTARWREFDNLFAHVERGELNRVLDVSSQERLLQDHLPEGVELVAVDPVEQRYLDGHAEFKPESVTGPTKASFDLAVSLAAIHCIENKADFVRTLLEFVRPRGWVVIADVLAESAVARFLDEFVCKHNGQDSCRRYWSGDPLADLGLAKDTVEILCSQVIPCDWRFENVTELVGFVRLFFHLSGVTDGQIEEAIGNYMGITSRAKYVTLNWELMYVTLRSRDDVIPHLTN